jgi:hypothetical protein
MYYLHREDWRLQEDMNEWANVGRFQGGTVVGGREFSLGHQQWCARNVRIQNSFFSDHKDRWWIFRREPQAVIRRGSKCVLRRKWHSSPWSGEETAQVLRRNHLCFRLLGLDCLVCQEVGAVKKDVMVQATAVYNHGCLAWLILLSVTGVEWQQSSAHLPTLAKDAAYA